MYTQPEMYHELLKFLNNIRLNHKTLFLVKSYLNLGIKNHPQIKHNLRFNFGNPCSY